MTRPNGEIIKDIHKLYDELGDASKIAFVIFGIESYPFSISEILYMAQRFNAKALEFIEKELPSVGKLHIVKSK